QHARENPGKSTRPVLKPIMAAAALLFCLPVAAARQNGLEGVNSIAWGAQYFRLTDVTYGVAGAGHTGARVVTFRPRWTIAKEAESRSAQVSSVGPGGQSSLTAIN